MFDHAALKGCATIIASGLLIVVLTRHGTAQTEVPHGSTTDGVYSTAQAAQGEETYFNLCVSCHPIATHTGATFAVRWSGRPLGELYDAIKDQMPKNDPGSLTPDESAQLVAYLLKLNGMPAGKTELAPDAEMLKKIRIEAPSVPPGKADGR